MSPPVQWRPLVQQHQPGNPTHIKQDGGSGNKGLLSVLTGCESHKAVVMICDGTVARQTCRTNLNLLAEHLGFYPDYRHILSCRVWDAFWVGTPPITIGVMNWLSTYNASLAAVSSSAGFSTLPGVAH